MLTTKMVGHPIEVENLINPLPPEVEAEEDLHSLAISMDKGEPMVATPPEDKEVDLEGTIVVEVELDKSLTQVQLPRNPKLTLRPLIKISRTGVMFAVNMVIFLMTAPKIIEADKEIVKISTTKPSAKAFPSLTFNKACHPVLKYLSNSQSELTNTYSQAYDELEQFEPIDTLNVINEIYSDCVKPDVYFGLSQDKCTENVDSLNN